MEYQVSTFVEPEAASFRHRVPFYWRGAGLLQMIYGNFAPAITVVLSIMFILGAIAAIGTVFSNVVAFGMLPLILYGIGAIAIGMQPKGYHLQLRIVKWNQLDKQDRKRMLPVAKMVWLDQDSGNAAPGEVSAQDKFMTIILQMIENNEQAQTSRKLKNELDIKLSSLEAEMKTSNDTIMKEMGWDKPVA